jgi:ribokinase
MNTVLVVGAINVDLIVTAARLPSAGETVVGSGPKRTGGGKGANAAVASTAAGAATRLVGAVGADDAGRFALDELRASGVDTGHVKVIGDEATGTALIVVDAAGENQIAVGAGANLAIAAVDVEQAVALAQADCVLVSTEISQPAVVAAVRAATAGRASLCVLNPAPVTPGLSALLGSSLLVTPNAGEAADLARQLGLADHGSPAEVAARVADHTGATLVVTLGAAGAVIVPPGREAVAVPPHVVDTVVDTTGAGDCFNGTLAAALAGGADIESATRAATVAAGRSVRFSGARPSAIATPRKK